VLKALKKPQTPANNNASSGISATLKQQQQKTIKKTYKNITNSQKISITQCKKIT